MRAFSIGVSALATITALYPLVHGESDAKQARDLSQQYAPHELVARDRLFASLTEEVRRDLEKRDPSEYDLNLEMFMDREHLEPDSFWRRDRASGPGDTNCVNGNVAMTYDDGPYTWNRELTDMWSNAQQYITYFINVNNWQCSYNYPNPENLQYALQKNMVIASHTGTHPYMTQLSTDQIDKQVQLVETFTYKTLGLVPAFIRPPYGDSNSQIQSHLQNRWGLRSVMWNVDAGDNMGNTADQSVAAITALQKGSTDIILNHEVKEPSVHSVAPRVIQDFRNKGIKSSGMGRCLGVKAYKVRLNTVPQRDSTWNCNGVPAPGQS